MRVLRLFLLLTGLLVTGITSAQGAPQSPINLPLTIPIDPLLPVPVFNYPVEPLPVGVKVKNEGSPHRQTALKADLATSTAKVTLGAVDYILQNVHFHKRSEHYLNGNHFPMEMHLVHTSAAGANLAVGRWITVGGADNPTLQEMFANLPASGATRALTTVFNLHALKPTIESSSRFHYDGSLTSPDPPFNPNPNDPPLAFTSTVDVKWIMYTEPLQMSLGQMNAFGALWNNDGNWRDLQPRTDLHNVRTNVPEPGTVWLLAVAGLVAGRSRRRADYY